MYARTVCMYVRTYYIRMYVHIHRDTHTHARVRRAPKACDEALQAAQPARIPELLVVPVAGHQEVEPQLPAANGYVARGDRRDAANLDRTTATGTI